MATLPTIPVEPAGVIASSSDHNAWASACTFLLGSGAGTNPMFFLTANAAQALGTSFAAINWSSAGAIFKDNDGGYSSSTAGRYTVQTAGYWTIDWTVTCASGSSKLEACAQVVTTASNPYNPSVTVQFQHSHTDTTTDRGAVTSGGLVPIYLYPGDYFQILAAVTTAVNTSVQPYPQFCGELVSA